MSVQRSALLPFEAFLDDSIEIDAIARCVASSTGGVLGMFVFDQPDKSAAIRRALAVAEKHGLPIDFHVDEGLDNPGLDGLEAIARAVVETRFAGPVLCGHACALADATPSELSRIVELVLEARLTVVSLPLTNLYLQDRGRLGASPQRRGLTRLRELDAAGVPVAVGSDNVADAFIALGRHDPMGALATAALAAHLDPPYGHWLRAVTTNARAALGFAAGFVEGSPAEDLLVASSTTTAGVVAGCTLEPLVPASASPQLRAA